LYFVQEVVGVFVRFRAPLVPDIIQ
jgi:hypothetical protein